MFFWRRVAPQIREEGLKPTATPGYTRSFRDLNGQISQGKSFSGYERNPLFLNQRGNGFAEVGGLLGVDFDDDARAVASIDWDRDGDLDLWVTNRTSPRVRLLQNNQPSGNAFLAIRLIGNGETTNRDAIGARLTLSRPSERISQMRTVHAGQGFLAQSSAWVHFGLGDTTGDLNLIVSWPGGGTETFSGLQANTHYVITQGEEQPRKRSLARLPMPKRPGPPVPSHLGQPGLWVANPLPFPQLNYTDAQGATRSTSDFLGSPLLVNLWATWCVPCIEELSVFAKHTEMIRTQNATVLALNVDGLAVAGSAAPAGTMEEVLSRVGYDLPHGRAHPQSLAKIELLIEYLSSRRQLLSIPSSFLVDAEGKVAAIYLEPVRWEQFSADVALLNASPQERLRRASPRAGRWLTDPRRMVDSAAYLGDYATLFGTNGLADEAQRLYQMIQPAEGGKDARAYYNRAKSAAQQGLVEQAMQFYQTALRLDPEYGQALTGLGALLLMQKRYEEAQPFFERALSIDPNHATALMNLAIIDQARGDHESALQRLRKVIARNPGYAQARLNLGSLLASMKRHDEAIEQLSKAVELDPKMVAVHINLAAAYMETGQWDKADAHYRYLRQLNPRMAAFSHYGRGRVLARQLRHADAVIAYRQAISLGAENAQTFTQLGLSLLALGEDQAALDALQSALKLDPGYEDATRALRENGLLKE